MHDPFIAVDAATDLRAHARRLRKAWEGAMEAQPGAADVRAVIERSWSRLAAAGLRPDALHPQRALPPDELDEARESSLLSRCMPALRHCLGSFALDAEHLMVVCDRDGRILWVEGHNAVRRRAEGITFTEGMLWTEQSAGTNAIGTALAIDHPVQIFSAEHFLAEQHQWWCSAAPIHNPATGELLGVVDLSGPMRTAHPHSLALVMAAAGMAEAALAADYAQREIRPHRARAGTTPEPDGGPLALELVGGEPLTATVGNGEPIVLSRRQAEILAVLALYPDGLTADQLTLHVYGEEGNRISTRAAMSRLRKLLGPRLAAQPYRLVGEVRADFLEIEAALAAGHVDDAVRAYDRPLLRESEAPRVVQAREELEGALRRAALAGTPAQLWAWLQTETGEDDLLAMERFLRGTPPGDPGRAIVAARMQSLRERWGMPVAR